MAVMTNEVDFSNFKNVFCDSKEALKWAYKNGLPNDAIVRTSSPAMLWKENINVKHIEYQWNVKKMKEFQTSIQFFSEEVYDKVISNKFFTHEEALCVAQVAVFFNRVIFKAACLNAEDNVEPRLFLSVDGNGGPGGNNMNSPWDKLLKNNKKFIKVSYHLNDKSWSVLSTNNISLFSRIRIGGIETLMYRFFILVMNKIPNIFFQREALVVNESELLIETAAALAIRGVRIKKIKPSVEVTSSTNIKQISIIKDSIQTIIKKRLDEWVHPSLVSRCEEMFFLDIEDKLNLYRQFRSQWMFLQNEPKKIKKYCLLMLQEI